PARADALRPVADPGRVDLDELARARKGDVDVLDHRLAVQPGETLDPAPRADAAVPANDFCVGARSQALFPVDSSYQGMLRENVLRAPEPVGVPAPQIVVHREVVLAFSAYGLVVNLLVRVIAGVGRGIGEASQRDEKCPGIEN